jgi:hypothetical protein
MLVGDAAGGAARRQACITCGRVLIVRHDDDFLGCRDVVMSVYCSYSVFYFLFCSFCCILCRCCQHSVVPQHASGGVPRHSGTALAAVESCTVSLHHVHQTLPRAAAPYSMQGGVMAAYRVRAQCSSVRRTTQPEDAARLLLLPFTAIPACATGLPT